MHTQLNCLLLIDWRVCLRAITLPIEMPHMNVQHEDHKELDAVRDKHGSVCCLVTSYISRSISSLNSDDRVEGRKGAGW